MRDALTEHDVASFDETWRSRWSQVRPVAHELRHSAESAWVRFYRLLGANRFGDNETDHGELLCRHLMLLSELNALTGNSTDELRVVTVAWSDSPLPVARDPDLIAAVPNGVYWQSLPYAVTAPDRPVWTHLYLTRATLGSNDFRELLLFVADDHTGDVIICPPATQWLYHPYDGGVDVVASDPGARDVLRTRHPDWFPNDPKEL